MEFDVNWGGEKGLAGGILHDTDTNQGYILRKVGNYPTYRIPYILREIGYIKNVFRKVRNYPNWY